MQDGKLPTDGSQHRPPGRALNIDAGILQAFGVRWLDENKAAVAALPVGTVIAVNMATDDFVHGSSGLTAMDRFEEAFGLGVVAWVHETGIPISLGGGLCQLRSAT